MFPKASEQENLLHFRRLNANMTMKCTLPYDLNSLMWDAQHKENRQHIYCYCGGSGKWYYKMLQCSKCKQWFHEACIQCLNKPLLYGDRFYVFTCSVCTSGSEYSKRLQLNWLDVVHLILYNLTMENNKTYFDIDTGITSYLENYWDLLQLPRDFNEVKPENRRNIILSTLRNERIRFKCAKEIKKRSSLWGLRSRVPPPVHNKVTVSIERLEEPIKNRQKPSKSCSVIEQRCSSATQDRKKSASPPKRKHQQNEVKSPTPPGRVNETRSTTLGMLRRQASAEFATTTSAKTLKHTQKPARKLTTVKRRKRAHRPLAKRRKHLDSTWGSSEDVDTTSSGSTLDTIIPPLYNFEGPNNPFCESFHRRNQSASRTTRQQLSLNDVRGSSDNSNGCRKFSINSGFPNILSGGRTYVDHRETLGKPDSSSVRDLKSSVNSYFGAATRIANGETYKVYGKRVTPDGRKQYLIAWDGMKMC